MAKKCIKWFNIPRSPLHKSAPIKSIMSYNRFNAETASPNCPIPRQGPFQHPSTQKTLLGTTFLHQTKLFDGCRLLGTTFLHQTKLFDGCRVYLKTKFIKILSTQVTDVTTFT